MTREEIANWDEGHYKQKPHSYRSIDRRSISSRIDALRDAKEQFLKEKGIAGDENERRRKAVHKAEMLHERKVLVFVCQEGEEHERRERRFDALVNAMAGLPPHGAARLLNCHLLCWGRMTWLRSVCNVTLLWVDGNLWSVQDFSKYNSKCTELECTPTKRFLELQLGNAICKTCCATTAKLHFWTFRENCLRI